METVLSRRGLLAAALLASASGSAAGQVSCPSEAPAPGDSTSALVVIVARVHADAIVFRENPETSVRINGCEPTADQHRYTSTLPDTIVPGVRYTNVEIGTEYRFWLHLECRAPDAAAARLCETLGAAAADSPPSPESREAPADGRRD